MTMQNSISVERQLRSAEHRELDTASVRYDPEAIAAKYRHRLFRVLARTLSIVWSFVSFALALWWDRRTGQVEKHQPRRA
ncbi:MAG: AarF/ABC1/UbiB kinase family protein, partial [Leptolyngbyaceae cyanobacterium SL_7_1]|nr:AarF/ABC1/UbiB kinase family protein [Leptolyngbyaceae cyanobacterium SL_7_1]